MINAKNYMRILVFIILTIGCRVNAETTIIEKYEFYEISANSGTNLLTEMDSKSHIVIDGKIYHAYTDTYIEWTFGWTSEKEGFNITWVNTTVNIVYTLPKLVEMDLDPELNLIWDQWYNALLEHEQNHGKLAIKTAQELESSIRQLQKFGDSNMLENNANQVGDQYIQILENRHRNYDSKTNHGESEGAKLPSCFYENSTKTDV